MLPVIPQPGEPACGNRGDRFAKGGGRPFAMREATSPPGGPAHPFSWRRLKRRLPVLAVTVAVLTILGPFGTFQDMGAAARMAYWGGLVASGNALFDLVMLAARRLLTDHGRTWPLMLATALLAVSLIQTLLVALLEQELRRPSLVTPPGLAALYGYVLVVTLLVAAPPIWLELRDLGLIERKAPASTEGPATPPAAPAPHGAAPFLDRIPPRLGRDLLALAMEDHYVRVHTSAGSDLILMRLRDAVAELTGVDGLQVHRSHWVAAAAVAAVERRPDGKLTLRLTNGLCVPVSRNCAPAVRAAGWAERAGASSA